MLPVYVSYFAGGNQRKPLSNSDGSDKLTSDGRNQNKSLYKPVIDADNHNIPSGKVLTNAIGFVIGFTIIFVALGAFAGSIGRLFLAHATAVNIITGFIVVIFGLSYMGLFSLRIAPFASHTRLRRLVQKPQGFTSSVIFGAVFSIGWTPCITAFLGAALMRASQQGSTLEGMLMLFVYSMGLGLPFIASAVLIGRLKSAFEFIQRHYRVINALSGGFLVLVGILMMTGLFGRFLALFS